MQTFIISTIAALVLINPATAWSQKEVMATINGSDAYTWSGYMSGVKIRVTIKPGERFIASRLSYGQKDWAVYLKSGSTALIPDNRIRVLPDEPLMKLNFDGTKKEWLKRQSKPVNMKDDTASQAEEHGVANYYKALVQASEGDLKAFQRFNALTPFMDGAAGEGHAESKWMLLHVAGDKTFAKVLAGESSKVRKDYAEHFSPPSETEPISDPKPYIKQNFQRHTKCFSARDNDLADKTISLNLGYTY